MKLNKQEMLQIEGGSQLSSPLLNAITKGISIFFEIGQTVGSTIRRLVDGNSCPLPENTVSN